MSDYKSYIESSPDPGISKKHYSEQKSEHSRSPVSNIYATKQRYKYSNIGKPMGVERQI